MLDEISRPLGVDKEHLVQDFKGARYYIISTNHESCRQDALRKMGDPWARPLPVDKPKNNLGQEKDKAAVSVEDNALDLDTDALSEDSDGAARMRPTTLSELIGSCMVLIC